MIVLICNYSNHYWDWLQNFRNYLARKRNQVHLILGFKENHYYESIIKHKRTKHVFIWNGEESNHKYIKQICVNYNKPYSILEVGYFPQKSYYTIDNKGINANSSLMNDDLSWVDSKLLQNMVDFKCQYLNGKKYSGNNEYILVPLQLEHDTNIRNHSPYKQMQAFIHHVESKFLNKKIIFKRHPLDCNSYNITSNNILLKNGSFLDIAQHAELVYGINSTCLLESCLMGVPTIAVGNCLINNHSHQLDKLMAALIDKQIPINTHRIDYWYGKYI